MADSPWDRRFFATTRGQLVRELRRGARTVDDLARALDLSDNAIRAHLATLERDGLIREAGLRRTATSRKPSQEYQLTSAADRLFPKAYDRVLDRLLGVLGERLAEAELEAALREVGRRLASELGERPTGDVPTRLAAAVAAMHALGGLAEVVVEDDRYAIRGTSCPLAATARDHAEVCLLTETLIGAVSGLSVCQRCTRAEAPRCHFEVVMP
ncbi:MAG TPA: helix-turn-helix domain-containing protein [Ktedonobacterales bacterium]